LINTLNFTYSKARSTVIDDVTNRSLEVDGYWWVFNRIYW